MSGGKLPPGFWITERALFLGCFELHHDAGICIGSQGEALLVRRAWEIAEGRAEHRDRDAMELLRKYEEAEPSTPTEDPPQCNCPCGPCERTPCVFEDPTDG